MSVPSLGWFDAPSIFYLGPNRNFFPARFVWMERVCIAGEVVMFGEVM